MDLESAEPAPSRRRLLGALGAAGLASAAALAIARPASAAPTSPTDGDKTLLRQAMELELSARDLYLDAAAAGFSEEATTVAQEFAANHGAYADAIAGSSGFSANTRNEDVYGELQSAFTGDEAGFTEAAISLENTAAATHSSLAPDYESSSARSLTGSIVVVEARMATVLADLGGTSSDLDALFEPDAEPLSLTGGAS